MNFSWVAGPVFQTMYRLVNTNLPRFPELAGFYGREVIDRGLRLLSRLLENGMDRGVFRRTDPLTAARMQACADAQRDPFQTIQLPAAALALKQGFGRLIRRRDDRGIVAILDSRIVTRTYGKTFFDTLPTGLPRTSAIEQVRRW